MKKGHGQFAGDSKEFQDQDGTFDGDVNTMFIDPGYDLQFFFAHRSIIAECGAILLDN